MATQLEFHIDKLSHKLYLGFAVPALAILGIGAFSLYSFHRIDDRIGSIYDDRVIPLEQLKMISDSYAVSVIDAVNKAHDRMWTSTQALQSVETAQATVAKAWGNYLKTDLTPDEQALAQQTEALFVAANEEIAKLKTVLAQGDSEDLGTFDGSLYVKIDPLTAKIQELIALQLTVAGEERQAAAELYQWTRWVFIWLVGLALLLASPLGYALSQLVTAALRDTIDRVASATNEIATATEEQERISSQQASSVQQTATTLEQLNQFAHKTAEQAESVASESKQSLSLTENGTHAVQQTLVSIQALQHQVQSIAQEISHLQAQAQEIGMVSSLVNDLANQTNMLALNAAVEAVRAGDRGYGFGIVAQEVRKLADQSKLASQKIHVLVQDIQGAIANVVTVTQEGNHTAQESVKVVEISAHAFDRMAQGAAAMMLNGEQIALSAEQQEQAIREVLLAIRNLNQAALETVGSISQTKVGMHQLSDTMNHLQSMV